MKLPKALSPGEENFALQIRALNLPAPTREFMFHKTRKFLFDFAWPYRKLAVEIDGGTRIKGGGRHNRHHGYERDCIKMALAIQDGWRVYRFTTSQVSKGVAIGFVELEFEG